MVDKKLLEIKTKLEAAFGAKAVQFASEVETHPTISSGSLSLDFAIGGGFPQDRVVEVAGVEASGKTTLGLIAMCNFLDAQTDRHALILDIEHKLTMDWVESLIGTERMKRVVCLWPDHMEQATDMYTEALASGVFCFCLFDSIGGAPTRRVMFDASGKQKSAETGSVGGNALAVTRFAQFAEIYSHKYRCCTYGVNQTREDMEGWNRHQTPGGRAWKHACSLRIQIKRGKGEVLEKIDGEDVRVGFEVVAKTIKNHVSGVENRVAKWWFFNIPTAKYGFGVDRTEEIVRLCVATGVIEQRGAWYYSNALEGGKIQSQSRLTEVVKSDVSLRDTLTSELMCKIADRDTVRSVVNDEVVAEIFKEQN